VSRQRFALVALQDPILSEWIALAGDQAKDGIQPQMVMIIEIFVAQHQAMNPLTENLLNAMFNVTLVTVVDSESRETVCAISPSNFRTGQEPLPEMEGAHSGCTGG
jgi:hypothetical protein